MASKCRRFFCRAKLTAKKFSCSILLTLFLLRAVKRGDFHRVGRVFFALGEDWILGASLVMISMAVCVPRIRLTLLGTWVVFVTIMDLEVFGNLAAWAVQTIPIYAEFATSFWEYIGSLLYLSCWFGVLERVKYGAQPKVEITDWLGFLVVQLWVFRLIHEIFGVRLLRWRSRNLLEIALHVALKNPFHAKFDKNFTQADTTQTPSSAKQIPRSFSYEFVDTLADSRNVVVDALQEKHASIIQSRQALLEEQEDVDVDEDGFVESWQMTIRRSNILEDSLSALLEATATELLAPRIRVEYVNEKGDDYGGLALDWFDEMGQALVKGAEDDDGDSLLFLGKSSRMLIPRPGKRKTADCTEEDRYRNLFLAGRFLALGVVHGGRPLPFPLSPLVCKYILGLTVDKSDLKRLDPDFYRARVAPLLQKDGLARMEEALGEPLTFLSAPTEFRQEPEELEPGGSNTIVTEENLPRYLQLLCDAFLCHEIREELQCLIHGFYSVVPLETLRNSGLSPSELAALVAGTHGLDVTQWREWSVERHGSHDFSESDVETHDAEADQILTWFWIVLQEMDEEQRRMLLRFATGSGRLPPGGFASLSPRFTLVVSDAGSPEHLPQANTCANRLVLCRYSSQQQLHTKLLQALPTSDFGFA